MVKQCSTAGCAARVIARGLCNAHYLKGRHDGTLPLLNQTTEDRFWKKVRKDESCWEWTGARRSNGYGSFYADRKVGPVHRYSYRLHFGEIPDGLQIDHICHNPPCVNPVHLRAVTVQQNAQNRKGAAVGSASGIRGVGWSKVRKCWRAYAGVQGKYVHGGYFSKIEEAETAAVNLRLSLGFTGAEIKEAS